MAQTGALSPKGERRVAEILDAALRCLARDGYSGTSLQRVADEAGLHKRRVLYYFDTREGLFEQVILHVGGQLLERFEQAIETSDDPVQRVSVGIDEIWQALIRDRALAAAWFGLVAESVTNPSLRETTSYINGRLRALIGRFLEQAEIGEDDALDRDALIALILAGLQGLTLDYLERGDAPDLMRAVEAGQAWLADVAAGGRPGL